MMLECAVENYRYFCGKKSLLLCDNRNGCRCIREGNEKIYEGDIRR